MKNISILFVVTFTPILLLSQSLTSITITDPRDGNEYQVVMLDGNKWFTENLRFEEPEAFDGTAESSGDCGKFYPVTVSNKVCPTGWRLPTEKEVKSLIKLDKKGKLKLTDSLHITLCGRVDNKKLSRTGEQNTFWLDSELHDGHITHWHTFGDKHELHSHDVVNADRKFPVRCVQSADH